MVMRLASLTFIKNEGFIMTLDFFNFLWIYLFKQCLLGLRLDTSNLPFSLVVKLIPFGKEDFWFNSEYYYDNVHKIMNKRIDLIIPWLCDIILIHEA